MYVCVCVNLIPLWERSPVAETFWQSLFYVTTVKSAEYKSTEHLWWCIIVVVIVCLSSTNPLLLLHDGKPLLRNPSFTFTMRVLPFLSCNVLRLGCWQEPMNSSFCHSLLMAVFYQAVQLSSSIQDRHWRTSGRSWR